MPIAFDDIVLLYKAEAEILFSSLILLLISCDVILICQSPGVICLAALAGEIDTVATVAIIKTMTAKVLIPAALLRSYIAEAESTRVIG